MFTRKQYMAGEVTHDAYFAQFVTPAVRSIVSTCIGADAIRASVDPHFNDIPLAKWDRLEALIRDAIDQRALGQAEDCAPGKFNWSLGTAVCIAKAAARMIKDTAEPLIFTRVRSDINGNPRYRVEASALQRHDEGRSLDVLTKRANSIGGKKMRGHFAFVFQSYNIQHTADAIGRVTGRKFIAERG